MMYWNPKFIWDHNLSFFGLGPWAIYPWYRQIGKYFLSEILMTPFERYFSKLSENHKIVDIGYTEDPISTIFWFSESLERDLLNDVLQSKIFSGP